MAPAATRAFHCAFLSQLRRLATTACSSLVKSWRVCGNVSRKTSIASAPKFATQRVGIRKGSQLFCQSAVVSIISRCESTEKCAKFESTFSQRHQSRRQSSYGHFRERENYLERARRCRDGRTSSNSAGRERRDCFGRRTHDSHKPAHGD